MIRHRSAWRWIAAAVAIMLTVILAIGHAARFLEGPASSPSKADLIVVLGGDGGDRGLTAARLYVAGLAPSVFLTGLEATPPGVRKPLMHWRAQVLAEAGVPLAQLEYDAASMNSWEEAVNTRRLMEARGWRKAVVVSDPYHMRRLSWTWGRVFEGSGLEYSLVASAPAFWKPDVWWRDEKSGQAVIVEYIKLAYYWVKY